MGNPISIIAISTGAIGVATRLYLSFFGDFWPFERSYSEYPCRYAFKMCRGKLHCSIVDIFASHSIAVKRLISEIFDEVCLKFPEISQVFGQKCEFRDLLLSGDGRRGLGKIYVKWESILSMLGLGGCRCGQQYTWPTLRFAFGSYFSLMGRVCFFCCRSGLERFFRNFLHPIVFLMKNCY